MTLVLLGGAVGTVWITCSVTTALVIARGIRLAERDAHPRLLESEHRAKVSPIR